MRGSGARCLALAVVASVLSGGCATKWSYRHGKQEAKKGNWDMAVAHFTKTVDAHPENVEYRISLEMARSEASRFHYDAAKKHLAADELEEAAEELEIAVKYDSGNDKAQEALRVIKDRIRKAEEAKKKAAELETTKAHAKTRAVVPVLSPRSAVPLTLKFPDASLEKVFETLSKLSGVNILFDESFKDKKVNVSLNDVTFEEALDQLTFTNREFYKVLDQKTLLIIPDTAQKRRTYEDVLVRTFYLESADPTETLTLVKNLTGVTKAAVNPSLAAITILGTFDEQAMAERIIQANDKPKGEVLVEVTIMEVNRQLTRDFGLALSQYEGQVALAPFKDPDASGFLTTRAHLLSSLNLSDFVVQIPSSILARFVQTEGNTRILAAPKLRAAEGKKTSLVIGSQVPVPTTTFQSTGGVAGQVFSPTTQFQYRDVGVKLDLTPKITATGEITLEMAVEFSAQGGTVQFGNQDQPIFLTRSVTGILRMRDGETTLLGGLIQSRDSLDKKGALGVSDIPVLRDVLGGKKRDHQDNEILISITPHLVRGPELTEEDFTALYVGSKESVRVPSARPPLFGPPETDEDKETAPEVAPSPAAIPPVGAAPGPPVPSPGATPAPAPGASPAPPEAPAGSVGPSAQAAPPGARTQGVQGLGAPGTLRAMVSPPRPRLAVGETKNLDVFVTTPMKASAVDVVLVYDAKVLEATGINPGSLLTLDGASVDAERHLEPGRVRATFHRASAASGTGVVATVTFQALAPGSTPVTVESMKVTTEAGEETLPPAGVARVIVGPAPAPRQEMKP